MQLLAQLKQKTNPLISAGLNLLFPARCVLCEADVDAVHSLCLNCFSQLRLMSDPCCYCCGEPFAFDLGEQALCSSCMQELPPYSQARAALYYDDASRKLITRLKYNDQQQLVPALANQMWRVGASLLQQCDLIVPVPLHPKRLRQRQFNQSALLAHALARKMASMQLPAPSVLPDALLRVINTPAQAGLNREQRLANVKSAFRVNHRHAQQLRGKSIVLIDDVTTTGATIHACCKALLGAQAKDVYVLTVAKKVKETNGT